MRTRMKTCPSLRRTKPRARNLHPRSRKSLRLFLSRGANKTEAPLVRYSQRLSGYYGRLVALGTSPDDSDFPIGGVKYLCSKEKHRSSPHLLFDCSNIIVFVANVTVNFFLSCGPGCFHSGTWSIDALAFPKCQVRLRCLKHAFTKTVFCQWVSSAATNLPVKASRSFYLASRLKRKDKYVDHVMYILGASMNEARP